MSRAFSSILIQWCNRACQSSCMVIVIEKEFQNGELIALCKASISRATLLALFAHAQNAKLSHTHTQCIKAFKVLRVELCQCSHTHCLLVSAVYARITQTWWSHTERVAKQGHWEFSVFVLAKKTLWLLHHILQLGIWKYILQQSWLLQVKQESQQYYAPVDTSYT